MATSIFLMHLLGDMPSPVIIGAMADTFDDVRAGLLFLCGWMALGVFLWYLALQCTLRLSKEEAAVLRGGHADVIMDEDADNPGPNASGIHSISVSHSAGGLQGGMGLLTPRSMSSNTMHHTPGASSSAQVTPRSTPLRNGVALDSDRKHLLRSGGRVSETPPLKSFASSGADDGLDLELELR